MFKARKALPETLFSTG